MAREANLSKYGNGLREGVAAFINALKAFEALVRADEREQGQKWFEAVTAQHKQLILAEREACAKVCEQEADGINSEWDCCHETLQDTAAAIRARGENNG
jgi:hypothetical protein